MIRTAFAFVKKDFLITLSYRFNFIVQIATIFLAVGTMYFIGKLVDATAIPFLKPYGGSYFGFLMIGAAFTDYIGISINSFSNNIREGQLTGTLEIILASPTRLFLFLFSSSLCGYIFTTFRMLLYFLVGILVFGLNAENANIIGASIIFILSIFCYVSAGIISAAIVLIVKKGESALNALGGISIILSGLLFPPELMPSWITKLTKLIPFTYSLHGLRMTILKGFSILTLKEDVIALLLFDIVFLLLSLWAFPYALKISKTKGSLMQY